MGGLVIFIFLFGLFNQILIAPFIQPGRNISDTSIIIDPNGAAPSPNPQVIIPKIDVEIPVIYSQASINEADIENSLEDGVVHYPTTVLPGQKGNAAFFGHSSNNVFTPGQYKYAFVLLHELVDGDTFYLTNNDKVYIYKVISKTIVAPTDVGVLGPVAGQVATATLITCDPPGTSLNRLIVVGQQISPDPSTDSSPTAQTASAVSVGAAVNLPGDGPSLWSDITKSAFGKVAMTLAIIIGAALLIWSVRLVIQGL
jgi:sortase A